MSHRLIVQAALLLGCVALCSGCRSLGGSAGTDVAAPPAAEAAAASPSSFSPVASLDRKLVFHPTPEGDWNPARVGSDDAWFASADGTRLHGWYFPHPRPQAVLLFCHGNAGNLASPGRAEMMQLLRDRYGVAGLVFDYRGYGRSEGQPDERGVLADARAARAWLAQRAGVGEADVVLLGRSLGGGVAVDLAARDGARGLILESTFTSLPDAAAHHFPWLPVHWLMSTRLDSLAKIADYHGPLLQCHGTADEVVPFELGQRLHAAAPGPDKRFLALEGYGHNDPPPETFYRELDAFLARLPPPCSVPPPRG